MEIERKFLLKNEEWRKHIQKSITIKQGYITTEAQATVRVRITDSKSFITIKGKGSSLSHPEYEYEIPTKDAEEMFDIFCKNNRISKTRHIVDYKGYKWEIDEFEDHHKGLILAEIELTSENEEVPYPDWVGQEVTGNPMYYNSNLSKSNTK